MALSEKHIRNIFIYTLPKFVSFGLNLAVLPILTRILSPKDFGVIALALAFPVIAVSVATAGMTSSVPRFFFDYRKDRKKLNTLYATIQIYLFLVLFISTGIVYLSRDYISSLIMGKPDYGVAILVAYIANYLGNTNTIYLRIYQNMEKAVLHSGFVMLQTVSSVTASLVLVWYFRLSYMGMLYGSLIGALLTCLTMFICFNKHVRLNFSRDILLENIKYGIQVVPKSFTGFVNRFFDKYMINAMLSTSAVGVYNIGQTITNALNVLMGNVWMSFQPACYRAVFDQGEKASTEVGRIFTIFSYLTLFPVIIGILFAEEIVHIVAPPSYYGAIDIIIILAAGITTQTFGMYIGVQYAYSKKPFWIFPVTVIGTICNVGLNIILIPKYGIVGAGVATMISTTIINLTLVYIGQKLYKIQYEWGSLINLFMTMILAVIATLYLRTKDVNSTYFYLTKTIFLMVFVFIGFKANIITKRAFGKSYNAFFRYQNGKGART